MQHYDYYIAVDWSQAEIAVAIGRADMGSDRVFELKTDIGKLIEILKGLKGSKVLTFEESTSSHWLYLSLKRYVDELIVCDPYNNSLLSSGAKNDRIDALKLLLLLRAGLLKPVFHSESVFMKYRMLLSAYDDLVKLGVSWKNRRKAQVRARGGEEARCEDERFNEAVADYIIEYYEIFKKLYEARFRKIVLSNRTLGLLTRIPGIGIIGAFKIGVVVDDPRRFRNKKHFWSYCGLVRHKRLSGGRSYGKRSPRYRRILKSVFKTAALACSQDGVKNEMNDYFEALIERGKPVWIARHMLARKIASTVLAVMKSGKRYDPDKVNGGC